MGSIIRTYRHITAAALLLTFLLYIGNIYLFNHTHEVNGVKISHSHIYSGKQDTPNHSHPTQQFNTINLLSTFNSEVLVINSTSQVILSLVDIIIQRERDCAIEGHTLYLSLRAPPVMA